VEWGLLHRGRISPEEAAYVRDTGAVAGHAEGGGDLGVGAALGEQLGRLGPSGLKGGTAPRQVGAAGGRVILVRRSTTRRAQAITRRQQPVWKQAGRCQWREVYLTGE
jgi:hypothetical protein